MCNEDESQTNSGAIIKSFFGSLRKNEMSKSKQQNNENNNDHQSRVVDDDSDGREDDIEQAGNTTFNLLF
jgi:hypothetical protein